MGRWRYLPLVLLVLGVAMLGFQRWHSQSHISAAPPVSDSPPSESAAFSAMSSELPQSEAASSAPSAAHPKPPPLGPKTKLHAPAPLVPAPTEGTGGAVCPGGICAGGNITGNSTVNNYGPPPPTIRVAAPLPVQSLPDGRRLYPWLVEITSASPTRFFACTATSTVLEIDAHPEDGGGVAERHGTGSTGEPFVQIDNAFGNYVVVIVLDGGASPPTPPVCRVE